MITCPKCGTEYEGAERFCPKDGTRLGTGEGQLPKVPSIPPDRDPLIGKVIQGRYKVQAQIGEGGMGVVYVAEHVEIEKRVALKVLRDDFSKRPEVVARFRQEARSAGKIGNAHIVDVTDFGQLDNGGVYFVMEHLQGSGLNDVIRAGLVDVERGARIVLQIARALKAAHKQGIVHRDLKPENIFLIENDEEQEFVKILDFGIAKISDRDSEGQRLTKTGMIFGTPEYMSPEQASGKPLDHRVDIYALGCIMFEMFTGRVPFEGETFMAVLTQHMFEPPPEMESMNPDVNVPESVRAVVYKAMAKEKDERYEDMMELAEDLERAMLETGATLREGSAIRRLADYRINHGIGPNGRRTGGAYSTSGPELMVPENRRGNRTGIVLAALLMIAVGGGAAAYMLGIVPPIGGDDTTADTLDVSTAENNILESAAVMPVLDTASEDKQTGGTGTSEEAPSVDSSDSVDTGLGAVDSATETEPTTTAKQQVEVKIQSRPEGAVVNIEGMGQVCTATPCEVSLDSGMAAEVTVELGGRSVTKVFTPSDQNREIDIKIPKNGRRGGGKRPPRKPSGKPGSSKQQNDLKIPTIFLEN